MWLQKVDVLCESAGSAATPRAFLTNLACAKIITEEGGDGDQCT